MQIIEAPHEHPPVADLFLGGGITNCPDWQKDIIEILKDVPGVALNPRRTGEFTEDIADEQITWEYHALRSVTTVMFWFPKETLCPITLLELGVFTQRPDVHLVVGTHPEYARRFDVVKQLELARPEVKVQNSIEDLAAEYLRLRDEVLFEEEKAKAWVENHVSELKSELEATKKIVLDEIEILFGNSTLEELRQVILDNYPTVTNAMIKSAFKSLYGSHYKLSAEGILVPPAND